MAKPKWPRKFKQHADEGNSSLDGGRHAWSTLTISKSGRVDVSFKVQNKVALSGYCFRAIYFFRDSDGNVLLDRKAPQLCVDGTLVPFAGPSKRHEHFKFTLKPSMLSQIADVVIVQGPGSKNPLTLLKRNVRKGVGIFKLVFA